MHAHAKSAEVADARSTRRSTGCIAETLVEHLDEGGYLQDRRGEAVAAGYLGIDPERLAVGILARLKTSRPNPAGLFAFATSPTALAIQLRNAATGSTRSCRCVIDNLDLLARRDFARPCAA